MIDNHSHTLRPGAVFNIDPVTLLPAERVLRHGMLYSVGIHPWNASCATATDFREVMAMAASPRVVAIGETGLDTVHQGYEWIDLPGGGKEIVQCIPSLERQMEVLDFHIRLSERLRKPLLLHIVKRYPEIIRLRNKLKPSQPWIIHGFRGKPGLAQDLLKFGFMLSYGERFNPLSVAVTPPGRMLVETDESHMPVPVIARAIGVGATVTLPALCRTEHPGITLQPGKLGALDGRVAENA